MKSLKRATNKYLSFEIVRLRTIYDKHPDIRKAVVKRYREVVEEYKSRELNWFWSKHILDRLIKVEFEGYQGKWVTLEGGQHIFIREGESVGEATSRLREKPKRITREEATKIVSKYKKLGKLSFIKGIATRGYSEHDVDLLVESNFSKKELLPELNNLNLDLKDKFNIPLEAWVIASDKEFQWYDGNTIREIKRNGVHLWFPFKEKEKIPIQEEKKTQEGAWSPTYSRGEEEEEDEREKQKREFLIR